MGCLTPQLYESYRESLIRQRDDLIERIAEINVQLRELRKEYDESKYLL